MKKKDLSLGDAHRLNGDYQKAIECYLRASKSKRKKLAARAFCQLGLTYTILKDFSLAENAFENALALLQQSRDVREEATALRGFSEVYRQLSEMALARHYMEKAFSLSQQMDDMQGVGAALMGLGRVCFDQSDLITAGEYLLNAQAFFVESSDEHGEEWSLGNLGHVYASMEDYDCAGDYYQSALKKSFQIQDTEGEMLWSFFLGFIKIRQNNDNEAYSLLKRSAELLEQTRGRLSQVEDPDEGGEDYKISFTARMSDVYDEIVPVGFRLGKMREAFEFVQRAKSHTLKTSLAEQSSKTRPSSTSLLPPTLDSITSVQAQLDDETALLEYFLTGEQLFIFALKNRGAPIVKTVEFFFEDKESVFFIVSQMYQRNPKNVTEALNSLYALLIAPVRIELTGIKRLVIVPHSILHYLPFAALYHQASSKYLIDQFELVSCPSASILGKLKERNQKRRNNILILTNSAKHIPGKNLPYAELEAKTISDVFPPESVTSLKRRQATLKAFQEEAPQFNLIHIACHGTFSEDNPMDSHILFVDDAGNEKPCTVSDILQMNLSASLVTLSCCETGLSQVKKGDELLGLVRGFLQAGASSLLVSLWSVNDKSTAELMGAFYRHLVTEGQTKTRALQLAMQEVKNRYNPPYHWAPFALIGDWK